MGTLVRLVGEFFRGGVDPVMLVILLGVAALVGFVVCCVRLVKEGEQAAVLHFGRFRKAVGPGFVLIAPPWRTLQRMHIRQTSLRLAPQAVQLRDGVVFNVTGVLVYRIADVYKALFEIANLHEAMADVGAGKLREVVGGKVAAQMWDVQALRAAIMERLRVQEEQWGVVLIDFLLVNVEPAAGAQQLFLVEELARRRVEAARITLEGFRKVASEVGLPPRADSPLWAALAGAPVTAAAFGEAGPRETHEAGGNGKGERLIPASVVEEQLRRLRETVEERLKPAEN